MNKAKPSYEDLQQRISQLENTLTQQQQDHDHKMNLVFRTINEPISLIDADYRLLRVNNAFSSYFKESSKAIEGRKVAALVGQKNFEKNFKPRMDRCLDGEHIIAENVISVKTGEGETYLVMNYHPFYDSSGNIEGLLATAKDVTKQELLKQNSEYYALNQKLNRLNKHYELINQFSSDVVAMLDTDYNPIYISPSLLNYSGYTPYEFEKMTIFDLIHPGDKPAILAQSQQNNMEQTNPVTSIFRVRHKHGYYFWNESVSHLITDPDDHKQYIVVNSRNIDARKKAELALKESEELFRTTFEVAAVGIAHTTPDGKFIRVNEKYCEIVGYEKHELEQMAYTDITHPDDIASNKEFIQQAMHHETDTFSTEKRYIHKSGAIIWGQLYASAVRDEDGHVKYAVGAISDITERKQLELALKSSEQRYKNAERIASFGSWELNLDTEKLYWSDEFYRICGYAPGSFEPTPESGFRLIHPEDREKAKNGYKQALEKNQAYNTEIRIVRPNGSVRWVLSIGKIVRESPETPGKFTGSYLDITNRKTLELELEQENQRLGSILANINMGLIIYNTNYQIDWVNQAIEKLFPGNSLHDNTCYELSANSQRIPCSKKTTVKHAFESGSNAVIQCVNEREDRWFLCTVQPIVKHKDKKPQVLEAVLEITDLKRNERELKKAKEKAELNEKKTKSILAAIPDTMFVFDPEGRIMDYHTDDTGNLYMPPESFLHQPLSEILPPSLTDLTQKTIKKVLKTREMQTYDYTLNIKGESRHFDARMVFVNEERTMAIVRDVTEAKNARQELVEAKEKAEESDRLKSAFLANVSHEVRTPMNGIMGFAELLKQPNQSEERRNFCIKMINENSNQLLTIVNDILDISLLENNQVKLRFGRVEVNTLLENVHQLYKARAKEKRLKLTVQNGLAADKGVLVTDEVRLKQILTNLLNNAFKFTPKGHVKFGYELASEYLRFFVEDTGIGMDKEQISVIFERFRQGSDETNSLYGGNGLGLSIAQKLVELLGGEIWAESHPDKGSVFYFTLPYQLT